MKKQVISTNKVAAPRGPLSQATRFGDLVFISGRGGRNPATGEMGTDVKEQTRFSLEGIKLILEEAGASLNSVVQTTCFLARREDAQAFNDAYAESFPTNRPARTTVIVGFTSPDMLVEINAIASVEK